MPNISIDIDCTKISKERLHKGKYLKGILIETTNSQYGNDFMIVESVTKEERDAGIKGKIIGNARHLVFKPKQDAPKPAKKEQAADWGETPAEDDLSIPF